MQFLVVSQYGTWSIIYCWTHRLHLSTLLGTNIFHHDGSQKIIFLRTQSREMSDRLPGTNNDNPSRKPKNLPTNLSWGAKFIVFEGLARAPFFVFGCFPYTKCWWFWNPYRLKKGRSRLDTYRYINNVLYIYIYGLKTLQYLWEKSVVWHHTRIHSCGGANFSNDLPPHVTPGWSLGEG